MGSKAYGAAVKLQEGTLFSPDRWESVRKHLAQQIDLANQQVGRRPAHGFTLTLTWDQDEA